MLSVTAEYALRAMVFLARNSEDWPIPGPQIAEAARVPRKYLSAVLADLVREGLLEGTRGKSGGFRLARSARRIRLADIVRSFEPVNSHRRTCPFGNTVCNDINPCGAHDRWKGVKSALEQFLKETTLEDVAGETAAIERNK